MCPSLEKKREREREREKWGKQTARPYRPTTRTRVGHPKEIKSDPNKCTSTVLKANWARLHVLPAEKLDWAMRFGNSNKIRTHNNGSKSKIIILLLPSEILKAYDIKREA